VRGISYRTCQSPSHGARELVCKHVSFVNTWLMDLCSIHCLVGAGFAPWHVADQSRDEVFMAAQESVGAHRDSQGKIQRPVTFIFLGITGHYVFWFQHLLMSKLCWAYRIDDPELLQAKF
jgi:hypothetical protein